MSPAPSPYEASFPELLSALHPRLRTYFGAIAPGYHGYGRGVFQLVGTPRRWLWPALAVLRRQAVLFDVWERDVPFTVVNRPVVDNDEHVAVTATRTFELARGGARMIDAITAERTGLVDYLGIQRRYLARLSAEVVDGALRLRSTRMAVRVGRRHLPLPRWLSPRVSLTERFDDALNRQHVEVILDAPLIGRIYEYAGWFEYEILQDETKEDAS
jgi:hypothetical protein